MPQFFITTNDINKDIIRISDKENFHHIAKVLRAKIGETLILIDENRTQYRVIIQNIDSCSITTKVVDSKKSNHTLDIQLYLAQSVLKTDAQNLVIQKATELGVKGIYPLITDNCVIKSSVVDAKIDKWQKIANEAVKQCERADFPKVFDKTDLKNFINDKNFDIKIACVERDDKLTLKKCLREIKIAPNSKIAVIVGPEGGFSAKELSMLNQQNDIYKVTLGKMILRAETAVINVLSNIIYELEND